MCVLMLAGLSLAGCQDQSATSAGLQSGPSRAPSSNIGMATLSWEAPTTDTNGTALTDLAGYRIYYGTDKTDLSQSVSINTVGMQTYVLDNLGTGTWYFGIRAVTSAGVESALSAVVSKTIG
jgi:hypothetical protein